MKKLALGALLLGVIAACGGGGTKLLDASVDAPMACNPIAQTGCMTGEKCTWVVDVDPTPTRDEIGHTGCVPDGSAIAGAACTGATAAAPDICKAGELCISRKCKPICDPQLVEGSSAAGACKTNFGCSVYAGVFESSGGPATAGVCEPTCDPITQRLNETMQEACGSAIATQPSATCVVGSGFKSFHCAPTGMDFNGINLYEKTDRVAPLADSQGNYFGNGCAPGFIPFFIDGVGSMTTLCSGTCAPVKMDAAIATNPATPANRKPWGDLEAMGKLTADAAPVAGHAVCTVGIKGSLPATPVDDPNGNGIEDCRFVWFPLALSNQRVPLETPFNDKLGVCFAYSKFLSVRAPDPNPDNIMLPEKSCRELSATPVPTTDPYGSALENGCYPLAESMGLRKSTRRFTSYRFSFGAGPAARHILD